MRCAERSGFLFAHDCDRPALTACVRCAKSICDEHTRPTAEGPACVTCVKAMPGTADVRNDDPYFGWGDYVVYYDVDDYRAFDQTAEAAPPEGFEDDIQGT